MPCYFQFGGDKYDFNSVIEARESNCHGVFKDKGKYRIVRFKVIEELDCDNCNPITPEEQIEINRKKAIEKHANEIYQNNIKKYNFNGMNQLEIMSIEAKELLFANIASAVDSSIIKDKSKYHLFGEY